MSRSRGLTLIELLIAFAIATVLIGMATPLVRGLVLDARMTAAVNALVHAVHLARQDAQKDLRDVVVCPSVDTLQCAGTNDWSSGWLVFLNRDGDDPPLVDPGEPILHATGNQALRSIASNRRAYVLRPYSLRATNGTVVFCDVRGAGAARAVIVSYTGRPRVSGRDSSGRALSCPA